jgi:AcrR family transcriptional regulator/DNA-binding MarR family transcriptional regulator
MAFMSRPRGMAPRLRPGPSAMPRGQVTEIQRARMLTAAVDAIEEVGYARMTVAQVISRARVSRKTFYDVFSDRQDCFLAAFEQATQQATVVAREAYSRQGGVWREGVRAALERLLVLMDEEPGLAKLCVVEALAAGETVLARRSELLEKVAAAIDEGRSMASTISAPPAVTAEGVVGGVFAVIHTRLLDGRDAPLTDLLGPLMSMIVLPYLGARAASRELARPAAMRAGERTSRPRTRARDPLDGLNMRLTYRTVRALTVIAERPGASNREIAEGSGITDQGQISKLLNRLARLNLVENHGEGQERGAANAWHLTPRGLQVERATRPR